MTSLIRRPGSGPVTLTRSQFGGTTAGKKPGSTYEGYLAYVNRRRAAKLQQQSADPFAPTSPQDIQSTVNRFAGMYGNPVPDAQIQTQAQGLLDPLVAAVTGQINSRAKDATDAIGLNSAAAAKDLAGMDLGAPYAQAKQEQAAVDAALRGGLAGDGAQLAGDLQSRLGMIDDPSVAAAAGQVAATGTAAGNTELARGSSALSNLIAEAAAAKEYGAKQPGIARLAGLQDIADVNRTATSDIGAQTAEIEKLLPGVVQNFRSENANLRGNKAAIAAQIYGLLTGQNVTKATAKAGLAGDQATLDYNYAKGGAEADAAAAALAERTRHDKALETGKTQLTPAIRQKALEAIDLYFYGVHPKQHYDTSRHQFVEVPGSGVPGVDYQTAIANLMSGFGFTEQQAISLANTRYQPGDRGRPMTAQQKTAAVSASAHGREADARAAGATGATRPPSTSAANPNSWDPKVDPIVAPGPPGSGTARTRSGRYVDVNFGAYVNAPGA